MDKEQFAIARLTPEQWTKARDSITLFWDKVPSQETVNSQMEGCTEAFVFTNESNLAAKRLYQSTGGTRSCPDDVVMFEYDWSEF